MKKWSLIAKKKLVVVLVLSALSALFGYVETLIPPVFPTLPFLRVHLSIIFAIFLLLAYGPAESILSWGVRSLVFGLVLDDGYGILFDIFSAAVALLAVFFILRLQKTGAISAGAIVGIVYAFVYTCLACIVPRSAVPFQYLVHSLAFYVVLHTVSGAIAYVALHYIPEKILFD